MNKKDIALTVGGVLATMILAYMFYRHQPPAAAANAAVPAASPAEDGGLYGSLAYYSMAAASPPPAPMAAAQVPALDLSSSTPASEPPITALDPSSASLLSQIIATYAPGPASTSAASGLIPALDYSPPSTLAGVPVTASDALTQAIAAIPGGGVDDIAPSNLPGYPGGHWEAGNNVIMYNPATGVTTGPTPQKFVPDYSGLDAQQSGPDLSSHHIVAHPITEIAA